MPKKFQSNFKSESVSGIFKANETYYLEIYDVNYIASPINLVLGADPVRMRGQGSSDTIYGVHELELEISVLGSDLISAEDFYISKASDTSVRIFDDGANVLFRGRLVADDVSEPYEDGLRVINIKADDGLGTLKTTLYEPDGAGKKVVGKRTILEIIRYCFEKTDMNLVMEFEYPYYPSTATFDVNYCTLANLKVHSNIFDGLYCFEVLERIATTMNLKIQQVGDKWKIYHAVPIQANTRYYQRYDALGNFVSSGTVADDITATFDTEFAPVNGTITYLQGVKEAITTLDVNKENLNLLANGTFGAGVTGWGEWKTNHVMDSYSFGGSATKKDPTYLQINGYQPTNFLDNKTIGGMLYYSTIPIMGIGENPREKLDISLRFTGEVKGKNVQKAYAIVGLEIKTNIAVIPIITLIMNDSGAWYRIGNAENASMLSGAIGVAYNLILKKKLLPNSIGIDLIDTYNENKTTFTKIDVESGNLNDVLLNLNITEKIATLFKKVDIDNITKVDAFVILTEGHGLKSSPDGSDRWVRWADIGLQTVDKARGVGVQKNVYSSKMNNGANVVLNKKAYFGDWYDPSNFTTLMTLANVPIPLWQVSGHGAMGDILMLLNRELISLRANSTPVYDGDILGRVSHANRVTLANFARKCLVVNYNYSFENNAFSGRLMQTIATFVSSTNTKKAVFDGDAELDYLDDELKPPIRVIADGNEQGFSAEVGMDNAQGTDLVFNGFAIVNTYDTDGVITDVRMNFFNPTTGDVYFQIGQEDGAFTIFDDAGDPISTLKPKWIDYVVGAYGTPTLFDTIAGGAGGAVYEYDYNAGAITYYRFIPTNPLTSDSFWANYNIGTQVLTNKLADKQLTII